MALTDKLSAIGNAIREKTGGAGLLTLDAMPNAIRGISSSGGGSSADLRYVTFLSHDGAVEYGKKAVAVGDDCADPIARGVFSTPTRESGVQYHYTFYGWATTPNGAADSNWNRSITEDKAVYANFASAVRYYTVTYYDSDGTTVLKTESLAYGAMPSYVPEKDGCKFTGWTTEVVTVTGDASYCCTPWEELVLMEDYTWAQIDAMTLEEAKATFRIGDVKDNFVLVGFDHDVLADGTKAKMSFICKSFSNGRTLYVTSGSYNYVNHTHYKQMNNYPTTYIPAYSEELAAVAKPVRKYFLTNRTTGNALSSVTNAFWFPSATELGYKTDETVVFTEGTRYEFFGEKELSEKIETWNGSESAYVQFRLGNLVLRSGNANGWLYLNSGVLTTATANVSNCYAFVGFCI